MHWIVASFCGFHRSSINWLPVRDADGRRSFLRFAREVGEQFVGMKAILEVVRVGDDDQLVRLRLFQKCI